jgi:UDP-N-acetylmuramate dehydrogenase
MNILSSKSLKELNQYGVDVNAKYFVEIANEKDITDLVNSGYLKKEKVLILGSGNNILFRSDFDGIVIKPTLLGKDIVKEDEKYIWIEVYCGEDWDTFVRWCVKNNYQGIENLVDIPSSIGGAVSQNIAAYGQNIMDVIESVNTIDLKTGDKKTFNNKECEFTYRNSIFKSKEKNRYLITSAIFKLKKESNDLEISYFERKSRYGSLEDELKSFAKEPYSIQDVMQAVINQRNKKLPSIKEYGTCGSVFENPIVTKEKYVSLSKEISELQSYPVEKLLYKKDYKEDEKEYVKIPAGRIIDELGWRGKWKGNVGMFEKHALCLVTNRKATGKEIYNFLEEIRKEVKKKYDINLNYEINIY